MLVSLRYRRGAGEMTISFTGTKSASPVKLLWLAIYLAGLLWSAANPQDYFTWALEAFPALIGVAVLAATRKHFPLTPLASGLILLHCWILFLGAHYTYAEVNTFRFIRDLFGWQRNITISWATSLKDSCRRSLRGKFCFAIQP